MRPTLICLTTAVVLACLSPAICESADEMDPVKELEGIIARMPDWPLLPIVPDPKADGDARQSAQELEQAVHRIHTYDLDAVRQAIVLIQRRGDSQFKLFALNRFLFELPDKVERRSEHFIPLLRGAPAQMPITGERGYPLPTDRANTLWPWERDSMGRLRFGLRRDALTRLGPPYDTVEQFDYCREKFGPRRFDDMSGAKQQ